MFSDEKSPDTCAEPSDEEVSEWFKRGFTEGEEAYLLDVGVSLSEAKEFPNKFGCMSVAEILHHGGTLDQALQYNELLSGRQIVGLMFSDVDPKLTKQYSSRFSPVDICSLSKARVPQNIAEQYDEILTGEMIVRLTRDGLSPPVANVRARHLRSAFESLRGVNFFAGWGSSVVTDVKILATGLEGIIFVNQYEVFIPDENGECKVRPKPPNYLKKLPEMAEVVKYSPSAADEVKLVRMIHNKNKFCPYVVRTTRKAKSRSRKQKKRTRRIVTATASSSRVEYIPDVPYAFYEYITGFTLEESVFPVSKNKVINYSSDILQGLCAMRRAGIFFYRDVRPANIMIRESADEAVIIDFGCAATNRHAMSSFSDKYEGPILNRRYSGPNDLTSVAQMMYKMATGEHLFNESKTMSETVMADDIHDPRTQAFANPEILEHYKQKIVDNVNDEGLAEVITALLTAKNYEYGKMNKMLKRMKEAYE